MTNGARTERIKALSKVALGIVRRCGDRCCIDRDGGRYHLSEVLHNEFRLKLWRPIEDEDRASTLDVRFLNKTVLHVEWLPEAVTRTSYKAGLWEALLLRYDRTPALAGFNG
jgi:hypothetical protein